MRTFGLNRRPAKGALSVRFLIASSLAICAAMTLIGLWVELRIYYGVLRAASTSAAHYMYASVSEPLQELAKAEVLSTDAKQRLLEIRQASGPNRNSLDIKVWRSDGSIAFATQADAFGT